MKTDDYHKSLPLPLCPCCGQAMKAIREDLWALYEGLEPRSIVLKEWCQQADQSPPTSASIRLAPSYELAKLYLPQLVSRCHIRWPEDHPSLLEVWT